MLVLFHPSSMNIFLQVRIKRKRFCSHVGMIFGNEVLSTVLALLPRVEIGYCRVRESWPGEVRMPGGDIRQEEAWQQGEGTKGDGEVQPGEGLLLLLGVQGSEKCLGEKRHIIDRCPRRL